MLAFGRHGLQSSELVAKSFTAVAASNTYSLALDDELQLWSWGHAPYGQHGHNREDVSEISLVKSVHVKSVSVSENFSVILDCEGRLFQAGLFPFDQSTQQPLVDCITQRDYRCPPHHSSQVIANFMEKSRKDILVATMATEIRSLPNRTWKKVVSGQMYLAILSESGELYMIGRFSFQPQALFTPFTMKQIQPPQGVTNWVDVASGWDHIIAIADTGCVYSWGWGYYGQLGIGEVKNSDLPILVDTLDGLNVSKIFCGPKSSACVTDTGDLYVFGDGSTHALGRSVDRIATCPELMEEIEADVADVALGLHHSCILDENGTVYGFGSSEFGQLPNTDLLRRHNRVRSVHCGWYSTFLCSSLEDVCDASIESSSPEHKIEEPR